MFKSGVSVVCIDSSMSTQSIYSATHLTVNKVYKILETLSDGERVVVKNDRGEERIYRQNRFRKAPIARALPDWF
jgi:hypothetical protein